jgi:hypothetical protein
MRFQKLKWLRFNCKIEPHKEKYQPQWLFDLCKLKQERSSHMCCLPTLDFKISIIAAL